MSTDYQRAKANGTKDGDLIVERALFNATGKVQYMASGEFVTTLFNDANKMAKEEVYNKDIIEIHEVTYEIKETILPITGPAFVRREVSRKVVAHKEFKYSKKNGASWK